ncbi:MAG TPA: DUF1801 domain-containing protein [Gammaproteobacteria bacterium]|nr:DUF1801 domain-containing protein [Gammaproteobacteria bacterium]
MVTNKEVLAYFESVPESRKERVDTLHSLIVSLYPNAVVDMKNKMPTYVVGDGWVALSNQKQYISLYTCGYRHIEGFKAKNPGIKTGKGCINFKDSDGLPIGDIKSVVKHAIEHPKGTGR